MKYSMLLLTILLLVISCGQEEEVFVPIEKVTDTEGNTWTEVPYLAQDTIFEQLKNNAANDPDLHAYNQQTPYLLKIYLI